jgi:hypothetical protein
MGKLTVTHMGSVGVNVDKNAFELDDNELVRAKNAISDSGGAGTALIGKRQGLHRFTAAATAGTVLGGRDLPAQNLNDVGQHYLYIGRGSV